MGSGFSDQLVAPGFGAPQSGARARSFGLKDRLFPAQFDAGLPPLLQSFRDRPILVLAPHFDDACFSLGGFLDAVGHGAIINIFTATMYTARGFAPGPLNQTQVTAIRDGEDQRFASRCGLSRQNLGCEEPSLRGRTAKDLAGVDDDLAQISAPLLSALYQRTARIETSRRAALFVPLAIGGHCNHVAVRELVLREYEGLSQFYDIFFYEDQSYARVFRDRQRAFGQIGRRLDCSVSARYVFAAPWRRKRDLVSLYRSQLRRPPSALRYWPRAFAPLKPHEAFWSFPVNGALAHAAMKI